jgi:pyruvate dehydrogenase E1 component
VATSSRDWIDNCPNQLYSALTFMGGAVWRKRLMDDLGDQGDVTALIESAFRPRTGRTDGKSRRQLRLHHGRCLSPRLIMTGRFAFLAYTIKGWGTPIAGHKDNHGGLMNKTQMAEWQRHMGVRRG